ncbi:hypothetical protein [Thermoanaerobacterium sp. RBIITD]|uniref:hypothetical protein n=1 Tax=Thermoanaerobacterium sp. RBIITD TaxID=1550240 RepID=UPI000BB81EB1|nr:hypothetical protein [Thermoanaerobacterium sp. RBIITD]SNX52709.1 hypothetical protein SAMN05660242_0131 [Thermoanaerobacterium sp. RBIITD]
MINLNSQNSIAPGVITALIPNNEDTKLKVPQDALNVYVNGDIIGDKVLVTQGDDGLNAVKTYLESNGFSNFEYKIDGNSIYINVNDDISQDIKNHLRVYLNVR